MRREFPEDEFDLAGVDIGGLEPGPVVVVPVLATGTRRRSIFGNRHLGVGRPQESISLHQRDAGAGLLAARSRKGDGGDRCAEGFQEHARLRWTKGGGTLVPRGEDVKGAPACGFSPNCYWVFLQA